MTTSQLFIYLQYCAMFLLGQALHLLIVKIPSLKKKDSINNSKFSLKEWWKEDWNLILATNVLGTMALVGLDQLIGWRPEIENVVKWFFAGIGAFGSSIAMKYSKYESVLLAYLDIKANITDHTVGHTENVQELVNKGTEVTNKDVTKAPTT